MDALAAASPDGKAGTLETTILGTTLSIPREYLSRTPEAPTRWIPMAANLSDMTPVADPAKRVFPNWMKYEVVEIALSSSNFSSAAVSAASKCVAFSCSAPTPAPADLVLREVREPGGGIERVYTGEQGGEVVAFRCRTIGQISPCYSLDDQMFGMAVSLGFDEKFLPQWKHMRAQFRQRLGRMVKSQGVGPNIPWQMETILLSIPRPYLNGGNMPREYKNITITAISPAVSAPPPAGRGNMTISIWEAKGGRPFPNKKVWDQSFLPRLSSDAEVGPAALVRYPDRTRVAATGARRGNYLDGYIGTVDGERIYLVCRDYADPVQSHCEYSGALGRIQTTYRFPPEHLPQWREIHQNVKALTESLIVAQ
jgi:hypothetical protein